MIALRFPKRLVDDSAPFASRFEGDPYTNRLLLQVSQRIFGLGLVVCPLLLRRLGLWTKSRSISQANRQSQL